MRNASTANYIIIKVILGAIIFFSTLALVYHIRWFVPFLQAKSVAIIPNEQVSIPWYIVQICSNLIFLFVGILLIKLFNRYKQTGFFDASSMRVLDWVIVSCIILALLSSALTVYNNLDEVHYNQWNSVESVANLVFRSFTRLLVLREPQTMYLLLAIILWVVKQFVAKALFVKEENEAFV